MSDPSHTGMSGRPTTSGSADLGQAREDLRAAAREARMAAGEAASSVKQEATATAENLKQEGAALLDTAKDRVEGLAEDTKQAGAERAQGLARAIHRAAEELERDSPQIARLVHDAAGSVDEVARAIRERNPRDMLRSAEDFARRQPLAFAGIAALAGFAVARFARSSAEHRRAGMGARYMDDGMYGQGGLRDTRHDMGTAGTSATGSVSGATMGGSMSSGSMGSSSLGMPGGSDAPASAGMGSGAAMGGGLSGTSPGASPGTSSGMGGVGSAYPHGPSTPHDTAKGAPGWVADEDGKPKPSTMGSASLGGSAALNPRGSSATPPRGGGSENV